MSQHPLDPYAHYHLVVNGRVIEAYRSLDEAMAARTLLAIKRFGVRVVCDWKTLVDEGGWGQ